MDQDIYTLDIRGYGGLHGLLLVCRGYMRCLYVNIE